VRKSDYTPFRIYDKKFFELIKAMASQQDKTLGQFMWDSIKEKTNKLSRKTTLYGFDNIKNLPQPPTNIYDIKTWKDYVSSLDKPDWKKFDELASILIDLTNNRRADLKKHGKL